MSPAIVNDELERGLGGDVGEAEGFKPSTCMSLLGLGGAEESESE